MATDLPPNASTTPGPRSKRAAARPDPQALVRGLEQMRESFRQRLDRIEALVHERVDASSPEPSVREQELRRRIAELEERHRMLAAEARRREQEHDTAMAKLEEDRRLLAEAWDRLEQERVGGVIPVSAQPALHAAPAPPPPPVFRAAVATASDDVVAQAILRQFQSLRSDVRRNANGRRTRR